MTTITAGHTTNQEGPNMLTKKHWNIPGTWYTWYVFWCIYMMGPAYYGSTVKGYLSHDDKTDHLDRDD